MNRKFKYQRNIALKSFKIYSSSDSEAEWDQQAAHVKNENINSLRNLILLI